MGPHGSGPDAEARRPGRPDAELLAAHVAGDDHAFGELVRRHSDRMWSVALRTLGDPHEASDAVQEAFIKALRGATSFRGQSLVSTWLHRIVVNSCLDRLRRRRSRPTVPWPDSGPADPALPGDPIADRELRMTVDQALSRLPADQRVAVVLVDMEGYPVDEAAEILGVPPGTVKSRCARGRSKLTPLLGHLRNPDAGHGVQPPGTLHDHRDREGRTR